MGTIAYKMLTKNRAIVPGITAEEMNEPLFWFTLNKDEALKHSKISAKEDYIFKELKKEITELRGKIKGIATDVYTKGPDEIFEMAINKRSYRGIPVKKVEQIIAASENKTGYVFQLRNPDDYTLHKYMQEGEEQAFTVSTPKKRIPMSDLIKA